MEQATKQNNDMKTETSNEKKEIKTTTPIGFPINGIRRLFVTTSLTVRAIMTLSLYDTARYNI